MGDSGRTVPLTFERGGKYREDLHGHDLNDAAGGRERWLTVPGNYGQVWTLT